MKAVPPPIVMTIITGAALLLCTLFVVGCSSQSERNYRILSFFFDGVPQPGGGKGTSDAGTGAAKGKEKEQLKYREHGPYAAKLCGACHISTSSNELVMPIQELCQYCHSLNLKGKKVHGPVVAGGCMICHDPHGSPYPFFLVSESKDFCFYCHDRKDIAKRDVHQGTDEDCTSCHNPHASDNDYLLR